MAQLIPDRRKQPIQAFMGVPGSRVDYDVTSAVPVVFQPSLAGTVKLFGARTNAKVNIVAHNSGHSFDSAVEPPMEAAEEQIFRLDGTTRDRISFQAVAAPATVTIYELADI